MIQYPPPHIARLVFFDLLQFMSVLAFVPVGPSLRVASWWRDPRHNAAVGGHPRSQHLLGLAIDVSGKREELAEFQINAAGAGLVALDEGDHVHVQWRPAGTFDWLLA